jgi:SAM-dependent methyltransferase
LRSAEENDVTERPKLEFGGGSIAVDYDDVLVPLMFDPWAELLIDAMPPESSWDVLDLATGTGIVASKIAPRLGVAGSLTAADVSTDMLAVARARLEAIESAARIEILETPAHPLEHPDASVDAIYCQQGFQFFPDRGAAAIEMHRVSKPGGRLAVSTWCPLSECDFFGMIAECLRRIGEAEAAAMMATPFTSSRRGSGTSPSIGWRGTSCSKEVSIKPTGRCLRRRSRQGWRSSVPRRRRSSAPCSMPKLKTERKTA